MKMIKKSEIKGLLALLGIIIVLALISMIINGRVEQWFGITWFSGASITDKIVFVADNEKSSDIYSISFSGANKRKITTESKIIGIPTISPNGTRIAFISDDGKQTNLVSVDGRGEKKAQLSLTSGLKSKPSFSPDGKSIAYISSGKVYISEAGGGKSSYSLPTDSELKKAMVARVAIPKYLDFAWTHESEGMIGVVSDSDGKFSLTYLPKFDSEAKILGPIPGKTVSFFGIAGASGEDIFVAAFDIDKQTHLVKYDAELDKFGIAAVFGEDELSKPAINSDGTKAIVALKRQRVLLAVDLENGEITKIADGLFTNLIFSPDDSFILALETTSENGLGDIVKINLADNNVNKLTEDSNVSSVTFAPPKKF